MSTDNIHFCGEIGKMFGWLTLVSGAMLYNK